MAKLETIRNNIIRGILAIEDLPDTIASKEIIKMRKAACNSCEFLNKENNVCGKCGCFLDIKWELLKNYNPKTLKAEMTHCPLGKWGDADLAKHYRILKLKNHD